MPADFSEVYALAADLGASAEGVPEIAWKVVHKTAADISATAKQLAPVDTGTMRASIGYQTDRLAGSIRAVIGPTVNYAPYVEFGTSRQPPQPFMGPAADRHAPGFYRAMEIIAADIL